MGIDNPNQNVKKAIVAAINWFDKIKLENIEVIKEYNKNLDREFLTTIRDSKNETLGRTMKYSGKGYDLIVVNDKNAKPIWARFYDLDEQLPIFVGWDGEIKYSINEIGHERRINYSWYGYWPENLLKYSWPKWKNKWLN